MPRLVAIDPQHAIGESKNILDTVQRRFGLAPNMMRTMANSPAVLTALVEFTVAIADGLLRPALRERIALAIGELNRCEYCVAAHSAVALSVGLTEQDIMASRRGDAADPRTRVALGFALQIAQCRGHVSDADVEVVRSAGYTDGEIAEIVAAVALNAFTNVFNNVTRPDVDFPRVTLLDVAL